MMKEISIPGFREYETHKDPSFKFIKVTTPDHKFNEFVFLNSRFDYSKESRKNDVR